MKKEMLPTKAVVPTAFQLKVYEAAKRIPKGNVTTYAHLAKAIGCKSSQAVGQALKRNPYAPAVPCHRIVASDLTLGGFNGQTCGMQIERKIALLKGEGVKLKSSESGISIDASAIYRF